MMSYSCKAAVRRETALLNGQASLTICNPRGRNYHARSRRSALPASISRRSAQGRRTGITVTSILIDPEKSAWRSTGAAPGSLAKSRHGHAMNTLAAGSIHLKPRAESFTGPSGCNSRGSARSAGTGTPRFAPSAPRETCSGVVAGVPGGLRVAVPADLQASSTSGAHNRPRPSSRAPNGTIWARSVPRSSSSEPANTRR
jgi:hypothetical protein